MPSSTGPSVGAPHVVQLPAPVPGLSDPATAYLLQEGQLLGSRIQWYLEQHEKLETLAIAGSGAIWAFTLSRSSLAAISYLAWIPAAVSLVLAVKSYIFTRTLNEAFQYLYELEEYMALPLGKGWVHNFRSRSSRYKRRWRNSFWLFLTAINIGIALLVPFDKLVSSTPTAPAATTSSSQLQPPSTRNLGGVTPPSSHKTTQPQ
jgi:hypothetical protein